MKAGECLCASSQDQLFCSFDSLRACVGDGRPLTWYRSKSEPGAELRRCCPCLTSSSFEVAALEHAWKETANACALALGVKALAVQEPQTPIPPRRPAPRLRQLRHDLSAGRWFWSLTRFLSSGTQLWNKQPCSGKSRLSAKASLRPCSCVPPTPQISSLLLDASAGGGFPSTGIGM